MFSDIKHYFEEQDRAMLSHGKLLVHDTSCGIFGVTHLDDAHQFFTKIRLERFRHLADLGCGDARVAIVASLFTRATGVELDSEVARRARAAITSVPLPEEARARLTFKEQSYYDEDLSQYDVIFMFPDKRFDDVIRAKLAREFTGYLFVYNRVFAPLEIKPGKTYWVGQIPIASYVFNTEERNLEVE